MSYEVGKDWTTAAGLRAVVLLVNNGSHRCGYVGVPVGHPLHGADYHAPCAALRAVEETEPLGKRSPMALLGLACSDDPKRFQQPDIVFDVHGGLTFSGGKGVYPAGGPEWWLGFDCAHAGDASYGSQDGEFRSQAYVEAECESLAQQIVDKTAA